MKKVFVFIFFIVSIAFNFSFLIPNSNAGSVTLEWDPPDGSPSDLAGYKIYYGNTSGNYTNYIDVGNVTTYTVTGLTEGMTYYFAATAYDIYENESEYSNEVSTMIPFPQYTLTLNKAGTGSGTVISSPSGINCGSDCSELFDTGTTVTLTASANSNSTFEGFTGSECSGSDLCVLTINSDKTITATFNLKTYTITASATAGGSISPSGNISINHGDSVTFTMTPDTGYHISDVTIDGSSAGAVSSYTFGNVTLNHTINAVFVKNSYSVLVTKKGNGNGTVISSPAGINCGSDCSETYLAGTVISLTVSPSEDSTFAGWSGACSGTGTCSLTVDSERTVTATFNIKTFTITATAGSGGDISPSGNVVVNYGSDQSFIITPANGYKIFNVKVDSASQGAINTYTFINVKENHTIEATFRDSVPPSRPMRLRVKK